MKEQGRIRREVRLHTARSVAFYRRPPAQKERAAAPKRRRNQEQSVVADGMQNIEDIMELTQFEEAWRAILTIGNEGSL